MHHKFPIILYKIKYFGKTVDHIYINENTVNLFQEYCNMSSVLGIAASIYLWLLINFKNQWLWQNFLAHVII